MEILILVFLDPTIMCLIDFIIIIINNNKIKC